MYSLHTYDVGMFGHIFIPGFPLQSVGISHWIISVAIHNVLEDDKFISIGDEIDYAMEHYLKGHIYNMSEEALKYIREQCYCYYVNVSNYFYQFKPTELIHTPEHRKEVAVVFKDSQ
ncbi:hypothetical protein [Pseudomonas phage D6]|nr:hypothetical protein [Pseudomonas phage D6]